jgi:hypothetical protein
MTTIIDAVSSIQFSPSSVVNAADMGLMPGTSPGTVNFNNNIGIFFNGFRNDGIWFTTSPDGTTWAPVNRAAGLPITAGSSPAAMEVPWNQRLFLFANWNSGVLFVTTTDLGAWTAPEALPDVEIWGTTSPSAVSFNNDIFIFYNGIGSNGIFGTVIVESNGAISLPIQLTVPPQSSNFLDIMEDTSPCAVVFGTQLYLFYISAGSSGLATGTTTPSNATSEYRVFATFLSNSGAWNMPQQVGTTTTAGVSPTAVTAGSDPSSTRLYLFWPTDPSVTMAAFDGEKWETLGTVVLNQSPGSSPSTLNLVNNNPTRNPYLFWTGSSSGFGGGSGAIFSTFTPATPA